MIVQGIGTDESVEVSTPRDARSGRLFVEAGGELVSVTLCSNSLRVLAKLAEAAADELDARAVAA